MREMDSRAALTLGALLRRHRDRARLTQEQVAERAQVSVRTIRNLESGAPHAPRDDTLHLLAIALDLSEEERAAFLIAGHALHASDTPQRPDALGMGLLPAPPTPLIGRERELAQAETLLKDRNVRLLTLVGSPGVGKTRFGLELAARVAAAFCDGVIFVPLAPLHDAGLVGSAIAQRVGVAERDDRPVEERLVAVLRPQESLLLLDNFEHVASAAPVVADLLAVCPRLKVCVTSRSPLHLRSEHRYTVAPLTLPSHETSRYTIEALTAVPAVTLLVERACAARADFVLTPKNAAAVSDICRRLDGLPLALELAAARLALFSPHELLARLDHAMDLLADGPQDLPIRQRALRGALAWSYELLTPPERAVFRWLAVCAGGCTLEDAEGLCAAIAMQTTAMQTTQTEVGADLQHAPPMHAPLALVARLIDHSLLQRWETAAGAAGPAVRLGMLEVVRDFATECLRTSGEEEAARRSHASYFAAFAETAAPLLAGPEQARWLERLDREAANLRAALAWSLAHPMRLEALAGSEPAYGAAQDMGAREIALRLVGALWRYWYQHGALAEGDQWLERVLARWDSSCVVADAAAAAPLTAPSAAEALGSSESPRLHPDAQLADALYGAGVLAFTRSDFGRAQARYEACLAQRHRLGDARGVAQTLNGLGGVARERGQLDEALTLYEASLTALAEGPEQAGSVLARANARNNIGITRASRGEFASALAAYEEALAAYRRLENRYMIGRCLASMGYCLCELGEYVRARALLAESLALHRAAGDEHGVALTLATLGMVAARQGDHVTAERRWVQAATRYLHVGNVLSVAQCLEELAILRASTGDTSHGVNESQAAVDGEHGVGEALIILGALEAVRSQLGAPLEPIRASLQERVCFTARRTLGGYAYDEAWEAGRALARDRGADETLAMCLARLRRAL